MWRTAKFLFYSLAILFTVYLIEMTTVSTLVAIGVAILLINGPEGVETWLVRQDILDKRTGNSGDGDE